MRHSPVLNANSFECESGCGSFKPLRYGRFGLHADNAFNFLSAFKHKQSWNALNVEARRGSWILVAAGPLSATSLTRTPRVSLRPSWLAKSGVIG
jgi:hypothetical protein